jgi:hypothetical protein
MGPGEEVYCEFNVLSPDRARHVKVSLRRLSKNFTAASSFEAPQVMKLQENPHWGTASNSGKVMALDLLFLVRKACIPKLCACRGYEPGRSREGSEESGDG